MSTPTLLTTEAEIAEWTTEPIQSRATHYGYKYDRRRAARDVETLRAALEEARGETERLMAETETEVMRLTNLAADACTRALAAERRADEAETAHAEACEVGAKNLTAYLDEKRRADEAVAALEALRIAAQDFDADLSPNCDGPPRDALRAAIATIRSPGPRP